ncbi:hypothetical protein [Desulfosporosinus lacus]|nr:hypothetical protein [Desulfosporosinus lacus]
MFESRRFGISLLALDYKTGLLLQEKDPQSRGGDGKGTRKDGGDE